MSATAAGTGQVQQAALRAVPMTFGHRLVQRTLGFLGYFFFVLPYARRIRGLSAITREHRLFVCNHVSLMDTIMIGGILWPHGRLPILVLGTPKFGSGPAYATCSVRRLVS